MTVDLCRIDWVAIAAIFTAIMVFYTYKSVRSANRSSEAAEEANKIARETLEEMKNERERAEQPRITISLDYEMQESMPMIYLAIVNQGLSYANDVEVRFDQDFINAFPERDLLLEYVVSLNGSTIDIAPGQTFKIYFPCLDDKIYDYKQDITVTYKYNWRKGESVKKSYNDVFVFNPKNYKWFGAPRITPNTEQALKKIAESTAFIAENLTKN